jgi:hydroxylysine kinase
MLASTMTAGRTRTSAEAVTQFVLRTYGLATQAERLDTERDEQFRLRDGAGRLYVLKISNPLEDSDAIDMQTKALQHVAAADPHIPTPRVVPTISGTFIARTGWQAGESVDVRLLTYLHGTVLSSAARSVEQAYNLGAALARLGQALCDFRHRSESRHMDWDLIHAAKYVELLHELPQDARRALALRHLQAFEREALPVLASQRVQMIHNDFNPHNILVDVRDPAQLTGILDFGDAVRTQLVNDVAIGAAYLVLLGEHPMHFPLAFVAGYMQRRLLEEAELQLLPRLMAARLAVTVAITEWRAQRYPEDRAYITKNTEMAWNALARLDTLEQAQLQAQFVRLHRN